LVAEEARRIMASLGIARLDDVIGRADLLAPAEGLDHPKARRVDPRSLLALPDAEPGAPRRRTRAPDRGLDDALDHGLIAAARPALERREPVKISRRIRNLNRTVGGMLSNAIVRAWGEAGLPEGTVEVDLEGSAGQSFGAWLAPGLTFSLRGEANDYVGKGLSGGVLAVAPPARSDLAAEENVVVGNTVLYGATGGRAFFRGVAGERFAIRNSGADAVVEGVGDHACEYMTGGRVVVLGATGRNFAAGMSGGVAFVLDLDEHRVNHEMVELAPVDGEAAEELQGLVRQHREETGSLVAEALLADWDAAVRRFTEVMPTDYKLVLAAKEQAEQDGLSDDETAAKMMEALHG
jgi:glutamate synthase (NADPH) large chain